ncbi:N-acetylglucosamine-1-phosphotransferase subunits alpha/beta-like [Mercenaria mercenaria]|uniref:N-acetylglucosamine-1-phosphotransferase subunits alpha/beta-like n=1 Tax=Mercenaria mercenaria TaxID=6596 RepID=UPI00234F6B23|nr:N-acetylglucosamine-1-phosphotransferase subunits alpha/beta-like [Mercenaria mercenaria]
MRFTDNGGLRYSLRSMEKNANWIRHVFVVTNGQVPNWLNVENPRVTIVNHEEIFDHPENLPTFSSLAIEHNIYKIRGISERFIYMNDDMFFGQNVALADLYTGHNGTKVYLAWDVPTQCGETCKIEMIKNDVCDQVCNYDHCAWDGGDCMDIPEQKPKDRDTAHIDYHISVFYTNAIYNRAFGIRNRRVIAHVPLFIEKRVNKDMVQRFPNEVQFTVNQKLRNPLDFQFGCAYMYFLMEGNNNSNRFEPKIQSPDVSYVMVTVDEKKTRKDLDMLLKTKRKFVCINDSIDYSKPAAADRVIALLEEYYGSMFPNPSSFEKSK